MRPVTTLSAAAALLCTLVILAACSGGDSSSSQQLPQQDSKAAAPPLLASDNIESMQSALPSPAAALAELRSASEAILRLSGGQYEATFANNRVVEDAGIARFSPAVSTEFPGSAGDMAYAIYHMNAEGLVGEPRLRLLSGSPNFDNSKLWVALSDWERGTWSFKQLSEYALGGYSLEATDGIDVNGDILVAVILLGSREYELRELTFDAYDEVEDNDSTAAPQLLPGALITGFRASMGSGEGYSGHDGDALDVYALPYAVGDQFGMRINFDKINGELDYSLTTQDGSPLVSGDTLNSFGMEKFSFGSLGELEEADYPLLLSFSQNSGYCDYSFDFYIGNNPEPAFTADTKYGEAPLTVNFDASASNVPGGSVALYTWQIRSTDFSVVSPADEQFYSTGPLFTHEFTEDGLYKVTLIITANSGFNLSAHDVIMIGTGIYDEIEDNDSEEQANELDPGKSEGWLGSLGDSGPFSSMPRYDGDALDYVWVNVPQNSTLIAGMEAIDLPEQTLIPGFSGAELGQDLRLYPDNLNQVMQLSAVDEKVFIVLASGQSCDYKLTWAIGLPPTLEVTPDVTSGDSPLTVNFSTVALDSDGTIDRVVWDFDDDEEIDGEGTEITHVFESDSPSNHFCSAVVIDDDGMKEIVEFTITTL